MINRIRDVRQQKGMTLADVAARCVPITTAQTVGRLETGMRTLSLDWMNRIAGALGVEPQVLLRHDTAPASQIVARLGEKGAEALSSPRDAMLPIAVGGDAPLLAILVDVGAGEYRRGDQLWLRQVSPDRFARLLNRDILAPRPGGRFAFGRMIDHAGARITILPPEAGQRQIVIDRPAWLAVAEMLVRSL